MDTAKRYGRARAAETAAAKTLYTYEMHELVRDISCDGPERVSDDETGKRTGMAADCSSLLGVIPE